MPSCYIFVVLAAGISLGQATVPSPTPTPTWVENTLMPATLPESNRSALEADLATNLHEEDTNETKFLMFVKFRKVSWPIFAPNDSSN
jgi:hypothetical protein